MFVYFNANPVLNIVGDCVVRAISVLTKLDTRGNSPTSLEKERYGNFK